MTRTMLRNKPKCFVDIESSGLDCNVHEILEFAAVKEYADGTEDVMTFKIRPARIDLAETRALEINGYNEAEWSDALYPAVAARKVYDYLKDCVIIGQNVTFDLGFIKALLEVHGIRERLDYHVVDICALSYVSLVPHGLHSLSLKSVCEFLGMEPEPDVHRALAGARTSKAVYDKLVKPRKELVSVTDLGLDHLDLT